MTEKTNCNICKDWGMPTEAGCPVCGYNKATLDEILELAKSKTAVE
jgi:hydrogenase maturation factor